MSVDDISIDAVDTGVPADPGSLGAIPDGGVNCPTDGTPRNVTFTVSGLVGRATDVAVKVQLAPPHTWIGDVTARLVAPGGTSVLVFGRTGSDTGSRPQAGGGRGRCLLRTVGRRAGSHPLTLLMRRTGAEPDCNFS